jgi:hypothetical protein
MSTLEMYDTSANGLFQIVDTNWDSNGTLRVTVREMVGDHCLDMSDERMVRAMRRLARRALPYPHLTRSSRVINRFHSGGCDHVTFAVSRNET